MPPRILHLDLDAFFAAVEQRDKPSLRGKPVIVGGVGPRGVVSTASYEARRFGVHSAMSGTQAKRRCPQAAFLSGRFDAYRQSSRIVMSLLRTVSPLVEPLSLDEAYVDLRASSWDLNRVDEQVESLRAELARLTAGLSASVGVGSSKFIAKLASEAAKPNGYRIVASGQELEFISPMPVRAIPGVGPATEMRLITIGIATVAELRDADPQELIRELGRASGESLYALAHAQDSRPVVAQREAKSISTEDTFAFDISDASHLAMLVQRYAQKVSSRLERAGLFARTITLKVRFGDFTTISRARSLNGATNRPQALTKVGLELLSEIDVRPGVRLLGIGVSNLTATAQERLFDDDPETTDVDDANPAVPDVPTAGARSFGWYPGADVVHEKWGPGWVWGSGVGKVTVRFETRDTGPGPIRTFAVDDPALSVPSELPELPGSALDAEAH